MVHMNGAFGEAQRVQFFFCKPQHVPVYSSTRASITCYNEHELQPYNRSNLLACLNRNQDVSRTEGNDSECKTVEHEIYYDGVPVRLPPLRISSNLRTEVKAHFDKLMVKNLIRMRCSGYAVALVVARKKDGTLRLCIDCRVLNAHTHKEDR